jgi:hypothetical protein
MHFVAALLQPDDQPDRTWRIGMYMWLNPRRMLPSWHRLTNEQLRLVQQRWRGGTAQRHNHPGCSWADRHRPRQ